MKKIAKQKLQAFSVGSMGARALSKKELEELRKKEEEEAAAHVFQEFVETFQEAPASSKVWVKAGTYDAGARKEDTTEKGKLYKPVSRFEEKRPSAEEVVRALAPRPDLSTPRSRQKYAQDKKKSNLELFKEELRQIQEEREERHKYKNVLKTVLGSASENTEIPNAEAGSYDTGDPNTTNLYLGNLNPKITEQQLMEIFGRYGPLASIKIMWPRSEEEKARGRNCGFVAFMSRKDGERALRCINGKEIMNYEMKLGWGKAVVIPPMPIYIPPSLQQPSKPPPPSGLPFNAQPPKHLVNKIPRVRPGESYPSDSDDKKTFEQILSQSIVKVVVPTERNILTLIHRMVEFVIREGPMFEAIIMNKEINNPYFRFLFENQSPAHVYYRWKLYSLLQGDTPKLWALKDFRMFKGGSVWRPPVMNMYTAGMPEELVEEEDARENIRGTLSNNQRDRLEELIRNLTPERGAIGELMAWCLEHAEAANEISDCIAESLSNLTTQPHKKIARLYLLSDILHNAGAKLTNASAFRNAFQQRLLQIMSDTHEGWRALDSRLQSEGFRARVTRTLQAWADWAIYPTEFLIKLNQIFLGHKEQLSGDNESDKKDGTETLGGGGSGDGTGGASPTGSTASEGSWEENGGAVPLDGAALRRLAAATGTANTTDNTLHAPKRDLISIRHQNIITTDQPAPFDDIDGVPVDEDIDGIPLDADGGSYSDGDGDGGLGSELSRPIPGFVPSRWESVEPEAVEAGAVTTSQWERLASPEPPPLPEPLSPARTPESGDKGDRIVRRATLREIELRVLKYQDEIESGRRALKPNLTQQQQVQHYRRKLLKKAAREAKEAEEAAAAAAAAAAATTAVASAAPADSPEGRERRTRDYHDEDTYSSISKRSKKSRELSLSPPLKRLRHRSRSRDRDLDRDRSKDRDREREKEREREREREREKERGYRRRSPVTPPTHHHARKHKHSKHKY